MPTDIHSTPVHLGTGVAIPLEGFEPSEAGFNAYIETHCQGGDPGRIVMVETSAEDWPMWECHPQGDEVVIVLSGRGTFHQELPDGVASFAIGPGSTVVNPQGVWHTADVEEPIEALYITPAPGTHHKER